MTTSFQTHPYKLSDILPCRQRIMIYRKKIQQLSKEEGLAVKR